MQLRPDPTTTSSSAAVPLATACGNCGVEERRLLHHVRHRGIFRRLCTSCVLRLHPQSFCPTCFQVYPPPPSNDAVLTCFKCYSSSHSRCVESPSSPPSPYICPLCLHPNAPIFKLKSAKEANVKTDVRIENCRVMDRDAAKKFLAAAKIASTSMNKAAVAAKAEAERRAKEAAFTRKRAKEALEHVAHLVMKEKSKRKEGGFAGPGDITGAGFVGIGRNGAYTAPAVREDNVNVSNSNRNGSMVSGSSKLNVVEEKLLNSGNVDKDNSIQVLAALNAVELRENEKIGGGITAQGEGSGVSRADDHAPMDVDEKGIMSKENVAGLVGERNNDSSSDQVNPSDMETGAETLNTHAEKLEDVNNEVILVQPVEHQMQQKDSSNGGEQHSNGSSL